MSHSWPNKSEAVTGHARYHSYLLRCWREGEEWRFTLEDVLQRRRWGFRSLPDMLIALEQRLAEQNDTFTRRRDYD